MTAEVGIFERANLCAVVEVVLVFFQQRIPAGESVEQSEKDLGSPVEIVGMQRFALGEGIEREESDFAAEVAAQLK